MKKLDYKIFILLGIIIFLVVIIIFMSFGNKEEIELQIPNNKLNDEKFGVSLYFEEDFKLDVVEVNDNFEIENLIVVYDILVKGKEQNIVNIENTDIVINVPYKNQNNYRLFNALLLDDENNVVETYEVKYSEDLLAFNVNCLGRFAIVFNEEGKSESTTGKSEVNKTTKKKSNKLKTKKTTTKKTTSTTRTNNTAIKKTTKTSTTTKTKSYSYKWSSEKDTAGQQYLYIVDESGNRVSGTVDVLYKGTDYKETVSVTENGILLIKSIVSISNVNVK